MLNLYGLEVVLDIEMTERVWVFEKHRFWTWLPKDEHMCRVLGLGHEELRPKNEAIRVGNKLLVHPQTWQGISMEIQKKQDRMQKAAEELLTKMPKYSLFTADTNGNYVCTNEAIAGGITMESIKDAMKLMKKASQGNINIPQLPTIPATMEFLPVDGEGPLFRRMAFDCFPAQYDSIKKTRE